MLRLVGKYPTVHTNFWRLLVKSCKKSPAKHSIVKPILLNFVNLSPTLCPLLQPSCPNWQYCKLGSNKFIFLLIFFHQLRHIITGRRIRDDCFIDSFFTWVIIKLLFNKLVLCSWEDFKLRKHNIEKWTNVARKSLGKDFCNSRKLRKVVAIYITNKLILFQK